MYHFSIETIIKNNKAIDGHWFDKNSLRFFKSRILSNIYGGRFFCTSEKAPNEVRRYSVREALDNGNISTIGDFQQYSTRHKAISAAKYLASQQSQPTMVASNDK